MTLSAEITTLLKETPVAPYNLKPDTEKELKVITADGSETAFTRFTQDLSDGLIDGIKVVHSTPEQLVLARQIDTEDEILRKKGISLRIRGTYHADGSYTSTDINIKTKKPSDIGMSRGEYEVRIPDPSVVNLPALRQKYAEKMNAGLLPDLAEAIELVHSLSMRGALKEAFLIATRRERSVIELDPAVFGYNENQRFFGEMVKDKIGYIVRSAELQESRFMDVIKGRHELELEPLHVPCDYNPYMGSDVHVCQNLDEADEDLGLLFFEDKLMPYAEITGTTLEKAGKSKAGRGFEALKGLKEFMRSISSDNTHSIRDMFNAQAPKLLEVNAPPLLVPTANFNIPFELKAA